MMIDQEILQGFCEETEQLLNELSEISDEFEDSNDTTLLEKFGQVIDRIMGAAYTLELSEIGHFCELGKKIGYKSSQIDDTKLIALTGPILCDTTEILRSMIDGLKNQESYPDKEAINAFATRLEWFLDKFQDVKRATTNS